MKHSLSISISLRQPGYTRGERWWQWLANVNHDTYNLDRLGGSGKHVAWCRLTILGVSIQFNAEHAISNWPERRKPRIIAGRHYDAATGKSHDLERQPDGSLKVLDTR